MHLAQRDRGEHVATKSVLKTAELVIRRPASASCIAVDIANGLGMSFCLAIVLRESVYMVVRKGGWGKPVDINVQEMKIVR